MKCRLVFHLCDVTGYTVRRVQCSVADETPQGSAPPVPFPVKRKIITSLESLQTKQKNKKRERRDKQRQYIFPKASVRAVLLHCKLLPLADRWKQLWYYPVTSSEGLSVIIIISSVSPGRGKSVKQYADGCCARLLTSLKWCGNIYGQQNMYTLPRKTK